MDENMRRHYTFNSGPRNPDGSLKSMSEQNKPLPLVSEEQIDILEQFKPFRLEESAKKDGYYTKIVTKDGTIAMVFERNPSNFTYGPHFGNAVVKALNEHAELLAELSRLRSERTPTVEEQMREIERLKSVLAAVVAIDQLTPENSPYPLDYQAGPPSKPSPPSPEQIDQQP
jgi:hypothetical protein